MKKYLHNLFPLFFCETCISISNIPNHESFFLCRNDKSNNAKRTEQFRQNFSYCLTMTRALANKTRAVISCQELWVCIANSLFVVNLERHTVNQPPTEITNQLPNLKFNVWALIWWLCCEFLIIFDRHRSHIKFIRQYWTDIWYRTTNAFRSHQQYRWTARLYRSRYSSAQHRMVWQWK